ncbi:MAG: uroporphyrinogen decarboxylase family protein [Lentisphaeria bacterium]|nr:uroporphyrinogen decarboxylase family protein [Lentisphaeria bacterium]MDP7742163.1 uroporphyrinogen decarboxylase family protein [Lentisphaeria bacterium]
MSTAQISSLSEAVDFFTATMRSHPERDELTARQAAIAGQHRRHPVFTMLHLIDPLDVSVAVRHFMPPEVSMPDGIEAGLAREIIGMLEPLDMLNPVSPAFLLGRGTGTLAPAFGIPLAADKGDSPAFVRPLDEVLQDPPPDPLTAGLMPDMTERIRMIKEYLPPSFKIGLPNMQGPFNLAQAVVGEEVMIAPITNPDKFHQLMSRITDFWIDNRRALLGLIGADYTNPIDPPPHISDCSANLVSADFYCDYILPYDRQITDALGPAHMHPCSGPHVFHATIDNLPLLATEAGFIAQPTSGAIAVDEAMAAIGDRPIVLYIGQELPDGQEYEAVRRDLDLYERTPRLVFAYTGMHWRKKDRPAMREIHQRLDEYWAGRYG